MRKRDLVKRARKAGRGKSPAKARSSAANGRKGGRPAASRSEAERVWQECVLTIMRTQKVSRRTAYRLMREWAEEAKCSPESLVGSSGGEFNQCAYAGCGVLFDWAPVKRESDGVTGFCSKECADKSAEKGIKEIS
jgi:hypothetical protein